MAGCRQTDSQTEIANNHDPAQQGLGCWNCILPCPYGVISLSYDDAEAEEATFAVALKCDFFPGRNAPACIAAGPMNVLASPLPMTMVFIPSPFP
jgi:Fe-S-cluster-containing hydrogenase component 2